MKQPVGLFSADSTHPGLHFPFGFFFQKFPFKIVSPSRSALSGHFLDCEFRQASSWLQIQMTSTEPGLVKYLLFFAFYLSWQEVA